MTLVLQLGISVQISDPVSGCALLGRQECAHLNVTIAAKNVTNPNLHTASSPIAELGVSIGTVLQVVGLTALAFILCKSATSRKTSPQEGKIAQSETIEE